MRGWMFTQLVIISQYKSSHYAVYLKLFKVLYLVSISVKLGEVYYP